MPRNTIKLVGAVWTLLAVLTLALGPVASASGKHCRATTSIGRDGTPGYGITVHRLTCQQAAHAIVHGKLIKGGNLRTSGYTCRILSRSAVDGETTGARIQCSHRGRWFRVSWAT